MIRQLKSVEYRLYLRKLDPKTGTRWNLGTFPTRAKAGGLRYRFTTEHASRLAEWFRTLPS